MLLYKITILLCFFFTIIQIHCLIGSILNHQADSIHRIFYGILKFFPILRGKSPKDMICQIPSCRFLTDTDFYPFKLIGSGLCNDILNSIMSACASFLADPANCPAPD